MNHGRISRRLHVAAAAALTIRGTSPRTAGSVKAVHIQQLRAAVIAIE